MKYKNIRPMSHNWSHSFMSYMNYVEDDLVCEELYALVRQRRGEKIVLNWVPHDPAAEATLPPRTQKSLGFYRAALGKHMLSHNVDPSAIRELRTEVWVDASHRMKVRAVALDDRGKRYEAYVWA